jgi:hypothetical protein
MPEKKPELFSEVDLSADILKFEAPQLLEPVFPTPRGIGRMEKVRSPEMSKFSRQISPVLFSYHLFFVLASNGVEDLSY